MQPKLAHQLPPELASRFRAAVRMGADASEILLRHFNSLQPAAGASTKSGDHGAEGLVTVADIEAERAILSIVRKEFPDDGILAEESGEKNVVGNEFTWVVDPLDGTNNFACGIPQFSVSIACCRNGQPDFGFVIDPVRSDWFVAAKGHGSWHNGNRVRVSRHGSFEPAIIGVGFYYDRGEMMRATLRSIEQIFEANALGVRRFGSAALDLVNVGLGRFGG
jgi:myo-inositol-1(or 4)-monophosphatase